MDDSLALLVSQIFSLRLAVLILIVVDDGLALCSSRWSTSCRSCVLILIVVDNGLVHNLLVHRTERLQVLILVVVEDGLVPMKRSFDVDIKNPS